MPSSTSTVSTSIKYSSSRYVILKALGSGAFGTVSLCYKDNDDVSENRPTFAVKETYQDKRFVNREGKILKMLDHPGIVKVFEIFYSRKQQKTYLNIVMEHFPQSLHDLIETKTRQNQRLCNADIKWYALQLFRVCGYLDTLNLCHRDIKPQNILVNHRKRVIKLADFGSAKQLNESQVNKHYICSRFYRAPELLCKQIHYGCSVDLWSVGCVMAEMYLGYPLFNGANTKKQLLLISRVLGQTPRGYPSKSNTDYSINSGVASISHWKNVLKLERNLNESDDDIKFLRQMVQYNPSKRLNLKQTLNHSYFEEYVYPKQKISRKYPDNEWTKRELSMIASS